MGREARANSHFTRQERQDRRLRRAAGSFRDEVHLYHALSGMLTKDWTHCLDVMWEHLTFPRSDALRRFLAEKLQKDTDFAIRLQERAKAMRQERVTDDAPAIALGLKDSHNLYDDDGALVAVPSWLAKLAELRGVPGSPEVLLPSAAERAHLQASGLHPIIGITLEEARQLWGEAPVPAELLDVQVQDSIASEVADLVPVTVHDEHRIDIPMGDL